MNINIFMSINLEERLHQIEDERTFKRSNLVMWPTIKFLKRKFRKNRYPIEIEGLEKIKDLIQEGPYVVAPKHRNEFDIQTLHYALYEHSGQLARPLAKKELFEAEFSWNPLEYTKNLAMAFWMRNSGAIPIDRPEIGQTEVDKEYNKIAIEYAMGRLRMGDPILYFPETHRFPQTLGKSQPLVPGAILQLFKDTGLDVPIITLGTEYDNNVKPDIQVGFMTIRVGEVRKPSDYITRTSNRVLPAAIKFSRDIQDDLGRTSNAELDPMFLKN